MSGDSSLVLVNLTKNTVICSKLFLAQSGAQRLRGLLGRDHLDPGEGMLFVGTKIFPVMWMHTFGMRFPIDIVFLNHRGNVIRIDNHLKPWRLSSLVFRAALAVELPAGTAARSKTEVGDLLEVKRELPPT